jgi:hypothetical protein
MVSHNFAVKDSAAKRNRDVPHDLDPRTAEHCWCGPKVLVWGKKENGATGWVVTVQGIGQSAFDGSLDPEEDA